MFKSPKILLTGMLLYYHFIRTCIRLQLINQTVVLIKFFSAIAINTLWQFLWGERDNKNLYKRKELQMQPFNNE
ncbi:hypothetical protein D0469_20325 [Peribacillus saganii]|uniref:Uncharacterized protein n=1 Tax=Peribacillus saganii TaxID=2303992 RepID=A0A372LAI5_9BACI|nr:hypothetical protein D0469_20325 [Peribacillus saganii]